MPTRRLNAVLMMKRWMGVTQCRESRGLNCGGPLGAPRRGGISTGLSFLHSINLTTFEHGYVQNLIDRDAVR